jgi:hypothetical protein
MANRGDRDLRLEAAACKEWNTDQGWKIIDETMQIRGGRGYEKESSLAARGEPAVGVERMMRDFRINRIFEGSSEIMHLIMAREAVDKHLQVAGTLVDPKVPIGKKVAALPKVAAFYAWWYPTRWLGWGRFPRYREFGALAGHLRFVERKSRKLAREVFHGMVVHGPRLQNKQGFLFRLVDITNELFAMATSAARAHALAERRHPDAAKAAELADLFCRMARRRIRGLFHDLWSNDDVRKYKVAQNVLAGRHAWLEQGTMGLGTTVKSQRQPASVVEPGEPAPVARPAAAR